MTGYPLATVLLVLVGVVLFSSSAVLSADRPSVDVDDTRAALEKWVETQRVISQEKRDLALAKETLNQRIELVQREIETLRGKISEAEESIAEADKKRAAMMEEKEKLAGASAALTNTLVSLEDRTKELLKRLPDPIRERVKPLSQRLPDKEQETKLSVAERFQNVVGILNEVNKFNRDITVTSEVRTLPDGTSAEVTTLYMGIGHAYYTGANGTIAGMGTLSDEGWVWKPVNEAAPEIAKAIAILKNEQVASFAQVPVDIE